MSLETKKNQKKVYLKMLSFKRKISFIMKLIYCGELHNISRSQEFSKKNNFKKK